MTVFDAAKILVARAASQGERGTTITPAEMRNLIDRLGGTYPTWLADLLTTVPLCRLEIGWQEYEPKGDVTLHPSATASIGRSGNDPVAR